MDTIARLKELTSERNISLYQLSKICDISYSTLKNAESRNGQLSLDSIKLTQRATAPKSLVSQALWQKEKAR